MSLLPHHAREYRCEVGGGRQRHKHSVDIVNTCKPIVTSTDASCISQPAPSLYVLVRCWNVRCEFLSHYERIPDARSSSDRQPSNAKTWLKDRTRCHCDIPDSCLFSPLPSSSSRLLVLSSCMVDGAWSDPDVDREDIQRLAEEIGTVVKNRTPCQLSSRHPQLRV